MRIAQISDPIVPVPVWAELAHYCAAVEELEERFLGTKPVRGRNHVWVEEIQPNVYALYWYDRARKVWVALAVRDSPCEVIGGSESEQPFDYMAEAKRWIEEKEK